MDLCKFNLRHLERFHNALTPIWMIKKHVSEDSVLINIVLGSSCKLPRPNPNAPPPRLAVEIPTPVTNLEAIGKRLLNTVFNF